MTLIEIMVAILVLLISVLGTSGIRCHTELNAARTKPRLPRPGSLLCESWWGSKGNSAYDPVGGMSPNVNIATNPDGSAVESGYSALGNFKVVVDDQNFYDVYWPWYGRLAEAKTSLTLI